VAAEGHLRASLAAHALFNGIWQASVAGPAGVTGRHGDGSAGDANYGAIGKRYPLYRGPEPRFATLIHRALGTARTVLNVGAGAGSYEPADREVTAVEPSSSMRARRGPHLSTAIDAVAEHLPFDDRRFDAAMAVFTIHQWSDVEAGLSELRRVTRGPVVILTCDPVEVPSFWLNDYAPGVIAASVRRYPPVATVRRGLGTDIRLLPVPIPRECRDGFNEAYYARPEMLLDEEARSSCSAWSFVSPETADAYVEHLRRDLASGEWDRKYGYLRRQAEYHGSLRLIVAVDD
jgi:SAM-dependent methyltransferase